MSHSSLGPQGTRFLFFAIAAAVYSGYLNGMLPFFATLACVYMSLVLAKLYIE